MTDHKSITEAELKEMEVMMEPWGWLNEGEDVEGALTRLIAEVRRLRAGARSAMQRLKELDGRGDVIRDLETLLGSEM